MVKFCSESESFDELFVGFFEEVKDSSEEGSCSFSSASEDTVEEESICNAEESKIFWELQEELLQTTLCRTTSIETKIRKATKDALREINSTGINCICRKTAAESCRNCTQKEISKLLQIAGYNCVICKSKWRQSPEIPSGEHSYMEVLVHSNNSAGKVEMEIIIELNFRAQFEMARSNEEYDRLINRLPEVYVGKFSRLQNLVKILCAASKKCMKEKKMHMAPWRKHKYMLAKWHGTPDLKQAAQALFRLPVMEIVERPISSTKPRASMLTFDLLENFPGLHCTSMIKVV